MGTIKNIITVRIIIDKGSWQGFQFLFFIQNPKQKKGRHGMALAIIYPLNIVSIFIR